MNRLCIDIYADHCSISEVLLIGVKKNDHYPNNKFFFFIFSRFKLSFFCTSNVTNETKIFCLFISLFMFVLFRFRNELYSDEYQLGNHRNEQM